MNRLIPLCALATLVSGGLLIPSPKPFPAAPEPALALPTPPQPKPTKVAVAAIVAQHEASQAQLHSSYVAELEARPMFQEETPEQAEQVHAYFAQSKALAADLKAQLGESGLDQRNQSEAEARAWLIEQYGPAEAEIALKLGRVLMRDGR